MPGAKSDFEPADRRLAIAMLAPPVIWLTHLGVSFSLVPLVCRSGNKAILHSLTVAGIVLTLAAGWIAWKGLRDLGAGPLNRGDVLRTRRRFMALTAAVFAALFTLLLVANQIPNFILRSCQ